ncbi:MAG: hypothetical protein VX834_05495 [Myxococcota bacterium]|nr:hypothetical protein [Myxococcota bacterium]
MGGPSHERRPELNQVGLVRQDQNPLVEAKWDRSALHAWREQKHQLDTPTLSCDDPPASQAEAARFRGFRKSVSPRTPP